MYKAILHHSRPQRPRSFWSAPRIETSGRFQIGTGQRSRFLVLTKRIVASGDENDIALGKNNSQVVWIVWIDSNMESVVRSFAKFCRHFERYIVHLNNPKTFQTSQIANGSQMFLFWACLLPCTLF